MAIRPGQPAGRISATARLGGAGSAETHVRVTTEGLRLRHPQVDPGLEGCGAHVLPVILETGLSGQVPACAARDAPANLPLQENPSAGALAAAIARRTSDGAGRIRLRSDLRHDTAAPHVEPCLNRGNPGTRRQRRRPPAERMRQPFPATGRRVTGIFSFL
ncbi:MAG: hypothetical protein ACJ8AW_39025 [Rhodopila sp.]